jgi:hypothetical protein
MNFAPKPSRKNAAHDWQDFLRDSDGLGSILAKTEDLARLRSLLKAALSDLDLEHLAPKIEVGWRSGGQNELFLLVSGASIATRLQQVLPSLINGLGKRGVVCSNIKVRIKPALPHWEVKSRQSLRATSKPRGLNAVARNSWEEMLKKIAPDSELAKAVKRLLQNKPK